MNTLKFSSRKNWTVTDFRFFLHQLNVLYNRLYVITEPRFGGRTSLDRLLRGSHSRVPERDRLSIDYIEIHSPGGFVFSGLGKVMEQVRFLIKDRRYMNELEATEKRQGVVYQGEMNKLEIEEKRIENARKWVELYKEQVNLMKGVGYSEEEIQNNIGKIVAPHRNILKMRESHEMDLLYDDEDT